MRRSWMAVFGVLCLLFLASCKNQEYAEQGLTRISVYYMNKDKTRISPVEKTLDGTTARERMEAAIGMLEEESEELSLWSVVNGYQILGWELTDTLLTLNVSADYLKTEPTAEILIRAALVRTLTMVPDVSAVAINVEGEMFTDHLGVAVGPMTAEMFIDNAGNEINAYEKVRLHLYFANETGDELVELMTQPVVYNSNISLEKLVVEQLIQGPDAEMEGAYPMINPETKLLGVMVKDGVCYVNLDETFLPQYYNVTADVTIYAIVNSLVELSHINKVQFVIDGRTDVVFRENFNLENVYERNLDLMEQY
ncbi:MAG: GerMN domain-containing protein [Lachnospiraceae bacterium]|nr:GerMN domain-containing protein [Lachnospiraceae bacterium]